MATGIVGVAHTPVRRHVVTDNVLKYLEIVAGSPGRNNRPAITYI
jgi:hypothetical protein